MMTLALKGKDGSSGAPGAKASIYHSFLLFIFLRLIVLSYSPLATIGSPRSSRTSRTGGA